MYFKILKGKLESENLKMTIFTSSGIESLQMISELEIGQCASEKVDPRRGWTRGGVPTRTLGSEDK